MSVLRVALGQVNAVVGDLDGNVERVLAAAVDAEERGADLAVFPELVVTGYPPEDLVLKDSFVTDNLRALEKIAVRAGACPIVVGFVDRQDGRLFNAAAVCADGAVVGRYHKRRLPNSEVFDEQRYFAPGSEPYVLFGVRDLAIGLSVCEDAWSPGGPIVEQADGGADVIVNLNGSPFHRGKVRQREQVLAARVAECGVPIAYVNLVGGQDELVFDGASLVVDAQGSVVARAPQYEEALLVVDVDVAVDADRARTLSVLPLPAAAAPGDRLEPPSVDLLGSAHETYQALVVGTRDYVRKNGFDDVVVGLSGGIDSSLVAAVAADALGPDHVHGVLMPSRHSSAHSLADAEALCANLGIEHRTVPIEPAHRTMAEMLSSSFDALAPGVAAENIQPRLRGIVLMALSNEFRWLVLTTGNKSELAVGYATLYGDMAGGYAVIKDVPKLLVFELCRDLNRRRGREVIPQSVIDKPPSAELRPDQVDTDSLPPYEELDPLLEAYIEEDRTRADLEADGFDPELIRRVVGLVDLAEYKRRQAPPGPRITTKGFGKDRRLPITNAYRG